jgi:hypothetical protein
MEIMKVGAAVAIGYDAAQLQRNLDTERVDLSRGLLVALKDPESERKWLEGRSIFAPARVPTPMTNKSIVNNALKRLGIR